MPALKIVHLVTGRVPVATQGRALILDMPTLRSDWQGIERNPGCPACHHLGR